MAAPKVFISYAWEDESHTAWVEALASRLRADGVQVKLDRWDGNLGDELSAFMEMNVRDSDFVLLVCTPTYKKRFDGRVRGVGYEARLIAAEILVGKVGRKFIAVHRRGEWVEAAPSVVLGDYFVDLRGDPLPEANYRRLLDAVLDRRELAPQGSSPALFEGPSAVPALPVPQFSGRDDEMRALVAYLLAPDERTICVVAAGVGGIGKTSLVRQFVATLAPRLFPEGAAWLDGSQPATELARVARRFGWKDASDPTVEGAVRFLSHQLHGRPVLLVIDNVDPTRFLASQIPVPGGRCRTLITSRAVRLAEDLPVPGETLTLGRWPAEIGCAYLRAAVPRLASESEMDLGALVHLVDGLPLAVRLLARAISAERELTPADLLVRLRTAPLETLDSVARGPDRGVAAVFRDAYRALDETERSVLDALAACARRTRSTIVASVSGRPPTAVRRALDRLADLSLAEHSPHGEAAWGLHDVLRLFVTAQPTAAAAEAAQLDWVRSHLTRHKDPEAYADLEMGIDEALTAYERLLARDQVEEAGAIFDSIGPHLMARGRYGMVIDAGDRLLQKLPTDSLPASVVLNNVAACYQTLGELPTAIDYLRRALATDERTGSVSAQAATLTNLGICLTVSNANSEAIGFLQRALALQEKLGRVDWQANTLGSLGNCYSRRGEYRQAIEFHERSLALSERIDGLQSQAQALGNLGFCYEQISEFDKAAEFQRRSLALAEKLGQVLGQALSHRNLGVLAARTGSSKKGREHFERALELFRRLGFPGDHSQVADVKTRLSRL